MFELLNIRSASCVLRFNILYTIQLSYGINTLYSTVFRYESRDTRTRLIKVNQQSKHENLAYHALFEHLKRETLLEYQIEPACFAVVR